MPRSRNTLTYRLRRLPAYLKRSTVADYLVRSIEGIGSRENIVVCSLASNLVQWERPPTKVATLMFKKTPEPFNNDRTEWTVRIEDQDQSLIFDTHFLDFTPLSDPGEDLLQLDCIAISGLASHPLGSWMQRSPDNDFVWLRDRLPKDMPVIRSTIYGYDTQLLNSESIQTIDDLASSFIARLIAIGQASVSAKPLVILAHSLGGILLRSALIQMASSGDEENCILSSIKMIVFFGVPTIGMHMSHLLSMVKGHPNEALIQLLSPESDYLSSLNDHFSGIACIRTIRLVYAYETKLSHTTKISNTGVWERTGPLELLVRKQSAVQTDSDHRNCFPINEDHSNMVKFSDDSPDYRIVLGLIGNLVQRSFSGSSNLRGSEPFRPNVTGGATPGLRQPNSKEPKLRKGKQQRPPNTSSRNKPWPHLQPAPDKFFGRKSRTEIPSQDEARERQRMVKELHDSLDFTDRAQRYQRISQAHKTTFDWVFKDPKLGLVSWLRKGSGVYWIRGKPGSGKSTLMKFLHDDKEMSEILSQWRQGRNQASAWFFFNERGSLMEKSFEGLLRAVIGELISKNKGVEEMVLKLYRKLKLVREPEKGKPIWYAGDLEDALSEILSQREQDLDILLLLDALDEYSGPPEIIAEFVQSLVEPVPGSKTKVKILFSSRPWDAFVSGFGRCPGFRMHEQTKGDLRVFALDQLSKLYAITTPLHRAENAVNARPGDIVSLIVDRAEGVFLWVKLVVESLLDAGPAATIQELEELVHTFPDGLEELYERTIERIPPASRLEAFIVIEVVNRAVRRLSLRELVLTSSCALGKTVHECSDMVRKKAQQIVTSEEALQLKNLCGGIIEINDLDSKPSVQFIHQTVKDFVSRPGFQSRMLSRYHAPLHENGFSFWMKYGLARLEMPPPDDIVELDVEDVMGFARLSEETTGNDQTTFLDSFSNKPCRVIFARLRWDLSRFPDSTLAFAVLAGLLLYTRRKLGTTRMAWRAAAGHPKLLHLAVDAAMMRDPPAFTTPSQASMIRCLLENGADPNFTLDGCTPFEYLSQLLWQRYSTHGTRSKWAEIFRAFLENGQDPNVDIRLGVTSSYKALHLVLCEASEALLEHGAHVNALDSNGRTALDFVIDAVTADSCLPGQGRETVSTLLRYGGRITYSTERNLPIFLSKISSSGYDAPEKFRNIPVLHSTLVQRIWDILPRARSGK